MKNLKYIIAGIFLMFLWSCEPKSDIIREIGAGPTSGKIEIVGSDPFNPIFQVSSNNGFNYQWSMGNGQMIAPGKNIATSYYPFAGDYTVTCTIYGAGGKSVIVETTFKVESTDPAISSKPMWKELTGGGAGRTWVYNTDYATGSPDYCFQTIDDLVTYPDNWKPSNSWGQCVRITPDILGEMTFDLDNGVNYTYRKNQTDNGIQGSFVLDVEKKTITIKNPYILDHDIDCTNSSVTSTGVYEIKLLTDDEMVLWQNQKDGTGWSWSFKRK